MDADDEPVVIDAEQRPSRRELRLVGEQAGALKEKGVTVVVIQAGAMAEGFPLEELEAKLKDLGR